MNKMHAVRVMKSTFFVKQAKKHYVNSHSLSEASRS